MLEHKPDKYMLASAEHKLAMEAFKALRVQINREGVSHPHHCAPDGEAEGREEAAAAQPRSLLTSPNSSGL